MLGYRWSYVSYSNVSDNVSSIMKKAEELMRLGYIYEVFIRQGRHQYSVNCPDGQLAYNKNFPLVSKNVLWWNFVRHLEEIFQVVLYIFVKQQRKMWPW